MELVEIIAAGHKGRLAANVANVAGIAEADARAALEALVGEVAGRIAAKVADPAELELLLDVIEAGEHDDYLDSADALLSREAIQEGEEILTHVYGGLDAARAAAARLPRPASLDGPRMGSLMTLAATLSVAALTRRGRATWLPAAGDGYGSSLLGALIQGLIQGLTHVPARRRRRRTRATYSPRYAGSRKRKRKTATRRRTAEPTLADVFGELLKR